MVYSGDPAATAVWSVDMTQLMFALFVFSQVSAAGARGQAEHAGAGAQEIHGAGWCVLQREHISTRIVDVSWTGLLILKQLEERNLIYEQEAVVWGQGCWDKYCMCPLFILSCIQSAHLQAQLRLIWGSVVWVRKMKSISYKVNVVLVPNSI